MAQPKVSIRLDLENAEKVREYMKLLGADGESALKRIDKAARENTISYKALRAANDDLAGSMRSLAGQAGPLGNIISAIGPAGIAAAAGIGAFVAIQSQALRAFGEMERATLRFDAVLKATGNTTGMAVQELKEFANTLSSATAIDDKDIMEAQATLATFGNVSGDVFRGVLEQAANLSATFGGDFKGNVEALGKAMESIAGGGVEGLRKSFKALTPVQEEQIKKLAESGQVWKAQQAFIDAMNNTIGGSAGAAAGGLIGATNRLGNSWDNLMQNVAASGPVKDAIKLLTQLLDLVNQAFDKSAVKRLSEVDASITERQKRVDELAEKARGKSNLDPVVGVYAQEKAVLEQQQKLKEALQFQLQTEKDLGAIKRNHALDDQKRFERESKSIRDNSAAGKAAIKQTSEFAREQEKAMREAEKAAEDARKEFERFSDSLSDGFADIWVKLRKDGSSSFKDIAEDAVSYMDKAFARISSDAVIKMVLSPSVLGSNSAGGVSSQGSSSGGFSFSDLPNVNFDKIFGSGSTGFIDGIGSSLGFAAEGARPFASFVGPIPGVGGELFSSTLSSTLGNSGYGFIGSTASQLLGLGNGGIESQIGSTAGSLIGSAVGGPFGAIAGGFIGDALGGLIGGKQLPPNKGTGYNVMLGANGNVTQRWDDDSDQQTQQLREQFASYVDNLFLAVSSATGVKTFGQGFGFATGARDPSTLQIGLGPQMQFGVGDVQGPINYIGSHLQELFQQVSDPVFKKILGFGGDLATISSNLEFGKLYNTMTKVTPALTQVEQNFKNLTEQLNAYRTKADSLGIDPNVVSWNAAQQMNMQIKDALSAENDPKAYALNIAAREAQARLDYAKLVGADLLKVEEYNALLRKNILKEYSTDAVSIEQRTADERLAVLKKSGAELSAYLNSQLLGETSTLSPYEKFKEAQRQFNSSLGAARQSGDTTDLVKAADSLLNAARPALGAGSADYADLTRFTRSSLINLGKSLQIPGFATGTSGAPAGWAWVGERGPELMPFNGGERVLNSGQSSKIFQGDVVSALNEQTSILRAELAALRNDVSRLEREQRLTRLAGQAA